MTAPHVTTNRIPAVALAPDLAANIRQAQYAGDVEYARAEAAGLANAERADAYHFAFVETMRELGTPMPCSCPHCSAPADAPTNPTEAQLDEWADWLYEQANS